MTVYLAFYKSTSPSATLLDKTISFVDGSVYSHVEFAITREDGLYDLYSSSGRDGGVRHKTIPLPNDKWELIKVDVNPFLVRMKYRHCQGCKYDFFGLLATKVPYLKGIPNRWYCSEFCAYVLGYKDYENYGVKRLYNEVTKDKV